MPDDIYFEEPSVDEGYAVAEAEAVEEKPEDARTSFERRLIAVQRKLKAPKNQWNSFGKYSFRSCEDILEGLKPLLEEYDMLLTINDNIITVGDRFYVKATATLRDPVSGESISVNGFAREPLDKKGSDQSQVTGSCSSYARKYALNAMFLIDDNKDADATQGQQAQGKQPAQPKLPPASGQFNAHCTNCNTRYTFANVAQYTSWLNANRCCSQPNWVVE